MARIEFVDAPGRRYDLFFLFALYFNKEHCLENFVNTDKAREDTEFMERLWDEISPVPEELLPFFRLNDDGMSLITRCHFSNGPELLTDFEPGNVFAGTDEMITAVLDFWLGGVNADPRLPDGLREISAAINNSGCDYRMKSALYSLLVDPDRALDILVSELKRGQKVKSGQYVLKKPDELKKAFNSERISREISACGQPIDLSFQGTAYVSFCTFAKNVIRIFHIGGDALLLLGQDYEAQLASLRRRTEVPQLDVFGTAISEKNRIDILNLILARGEVSIKDVEQELKFSGTNAYYHLSLMIKANRIKTRNRGKAVYYSINRRFFDSIIRVLGKYGELSAFSAKGCDAGGPEWARRMGGE